MWMLLWYSDIQLFLWLLICEFKSESTEDYHKKTLGMPKKNASIDHNTSSDCAGLISELYCLNFGHCELWTTFVQVGRCVLCDKLHSSLLICNNTTNQHWLSTIWQVLLWFLNYFCVYFWNLWNLRKKIRIIDFNWCPVLACWISSFDL